MRASTAMAGLAVMAALLAAGFLVLDDSYSGQTCTAMAGGTPICTSKSSSLIEENGSSVLALLAAPILLSSAGLISILPRFSLPWFLGWVVTVSYALLCVIAMFSIGFFFVPSAALLLVATALNGYRSAYRAGV